MHLFIRGWNKKNRDLADSAARFYADKLLGSRLMKNISLEVRFKRNLLTSQGHYGECWVEDEFDRRYPREFKIVLDCSVPKRMVFETLAHEMVHVKQYARGEMKELWTMGLTRFGDVRYNVEDLDYWDHPWEIEAHGKERGLFTRWVGDEGLMGEKWTFDFQYGEE